MAKRYQRVNWRDFPSTNTPRNAYNFNIMDKGINDLDNALDEVQGKLKKDIEHSVEAVQSGKRYLDIGIPVLGGQIRDTNGEFRINEADVFLCASEEFIELIIGKIYIFSSNSTINFNVYFYDSDKGFIEAIYSNLSMQKKDVLINNTEYSFARISGYSSSDVVNKYKSNINMHEVIEGDNFTAVRNDQNNLKDVFTHSNNEYLEFTRGYYIATNDSTVDFNSPVSSLSGLSYCAKQCVVGDVFTINGRGAAAGRLWCFVDANYNVISVSIENKVATDMMLIAPDNSAFLIINTYNVLPCVKGVLSKSRTDLLINSIELSHDAIWEKGTYLGDGKPSDSDSRFRNSPIKCTKGMIVRCPENYYYAVHIYDSEDPHTAVQIEYRAMSNRDYIVKNDGYIGINVRIGSESLPITNDNVNIYAKHILFVPKIKTFSSNGKSNAGVFEPISIPAPSTPYKYDGNLITKGSDNSDFYISQANFMDLGLNRVAKMYEFYDTLVAKYPNWIRKDVLGKDETDTYEIRCYTIEPYINSNNPKILFISNIHGAEIPPQISTFFMVQELLEKHNENEMLEYIFANTCIKIIPFANPWGCANNTGYNSNSCNLNRNFDANWTRVEGETGHSGNSPFDQVETQVLRDFILANFDAILAVNQHNSSAISELDELAYIVDNFEADRKVEKGIFRQLDYTLKKNYNWLLEYPLYNTISLMRVNSTTINGGTLDKWFNSVGIRGFLLEIAKDAGSNYSSDHSDDIIKIFIDIAVNLIGYMLDKAYLYLSDSAQTNTYTHIFND